MSLKLGSTTIGSLYLGSTKIGEAYLGSTKVYASLPPAPPERSFVMTFVDGVDLSTKLTYGYDSMTQVSVSPNVWNVTLSSGGYMSQFSSWAATSDLISVVANLQGLGSSLTAMFTAQLGLKEAVIYIGTDVTDLTAFFAGSRGLEKLTLVGGGNVTNYSSLCSSCESLKKVPSVNTSSATNVMDMFGNCHAVESGALALYQQMSSQATPPATHDACFRDCGINTVTGAAELAQIPTDWKEFRH